MTPDSVIRAWFKEVWDEGNEDARPAHAFGGKVPDRPIDFHGMVIARVKDGKVVEGSNSFDFLSVFHQLGLASAPGVPA